MTNLQLGSSLERLFRALADTTRLRLLNLVADREICVCYFVEILDESQPKVSQHLAYLRRAGLVETRREGKWMHYRLATLKDNVAGGILKATIERLRHIPAMRRDITRLTSACCSEKRPDILLEAPTPAALSDRGPHAPSDHRR